MKGVTQVVTEIASGASQRAVDVENTRSVQVVLGSHIPFPAAVYTASPTSRATLLFSGRATMSYFFDDYDDSEVQELRAQRNRDRARNKEYMQHPNCQDPDHPGCIVCMPEEEDVG